jgi:hypothetical protein
MSLRVKGGGAAHVGARPLYLQLRKSSRLPALPLARATCGLDNGSFGRIVLGPLGCLSALRREQTWPGSRATCDDASRCGKAFQCSDSLLTPPAILRRPVLEATVDAEFVLPQL